MADEKETGKPAQYAQPSQTTRPVQGEEGKDFKHLVRIMNTDLKGQKQILYALPLIKGIGLMFANAVCRKANVDIHKRAGYLSDAETKALEEVITNPVKAGIPKWMFDRRKDYDGGQDQHIISGSLEFNHEMDIKRMKKTKSYKGLRHQWGLPVRGQRTKSNFRRNKGKVSLGVVKKKIKSGKV
jgi:small subunit ribosomal protein S13